MKLSVDNRVYVILFLLITVIPVAVAVVYIFYTQRFHIVHVMLFYFNH